MIHKLPIAILFVFLGFKSFSQTTNTKRWRATENDSMQRALLLFDEKNYLMALSIYEKLYQSHPKEDYLKYCYGQCCLYRTDKHETALKLLNEVFEKNKKVHNIEYDLARANHLNYNFDESLALIEKVLAKKKVEPEIKRDALQLKNYCNNAKYFFANPTTAKITNSGNIVNTEAAEYGPVISADETTLIYTYRGKESMGGLQNAFQQPDIYGIYYEDLFQSVKENDQWTKPTPIKSINTLAHDAAIALSADGQHLFMYRDNGDDHGDIYVSDFINGEWTEPKKLKGDVNSYAWEGSCSLTADGKQLYFSSERGGGFGGKDIYRATQLADSTWGNVVNLGDSINTPYNDDAPFIHPDGVTLFYSSKGKNSMGGYDIFQSRLNILDSTFCKPVNLGYPINSPDDDIYYVLSANGERGYYASGKPGGYGLTDIYTVYPGYVGKKPSVLLVKGKTTVSGNPVEAEISVEITNKNNKTYTTLKSHPATGTYLISLPAGAEFRVIYKLKDYPYKFLEVSTLNLEGYDEKIFDISFDIPKKDSVKTDVAIVPKKDSVKAEVKIPAPKKDSFVATKAIHEKTTAYADKYGDITAEGLIFKVQIAAYKYPKNYTYAHLKGLGDVENLLLEDGITRITIGGGFENLNKAWDHCKKVITAGQVDAFVTVLYKGKRIYVEDLEKMGIFVTK